jgi:hypothetical protein
MDIYHHQSEPPWTVGFYIWKNHLQIEDVLNSAVFGWDRSYDDDQLPIGMVTSMRRIQDQQSIAKPHHAF